jgi:hypothetical protein
LISHVNLSIKFDTHSFAGNAMAHNDFYLQ